MLYLSVDPYFRGKMREHQIKSYVASSLSLANRIYWAYLNSQPAFRLGEPWVPTLLILVTIPIFWSRLIGYGIAVVLRSEHDGVKNGDYMYGLFRAYTSNYLHDIHLVDCTEHQQYNICTDLKTTQVINNQYNLPLSAFIGPAGMPGRCFIGIRIFSLSIRHRTSCIYGLEEILTCKGGGSLFVWLIAVRELSSYRERQFLWQLVEVSFLLSNFFIGVDCHIWTKGPVGS